MHQHAQQRSGGGGSGMLAWRERGWEGSAWGDNFYYLFEWGWATGFYMYVCCLYFFVVVIVFCCASCAWFVFLYQLLL